MLAILLSRISNTPEQELANGAAEQNKITHLRLNKLLADMEGGSL
jgi:2-oxo-4-hydroxy-4-carboxy--5-ureidoimidazoline (OHCU) decarboxylase